MEKEKFADVLYDLSERVEELNKEIKDVFCNIAKAFMEKYKTNQIQFDMDGGTYPTLSISQMDDDNADCEVNKIVFNEKGEIESVSGHIYYKGDDVFDEPIDKFYDIDYLELAKIINYQIDNGLYTKEE